METTVTNSHRSPTSAEARAKYETILSAGRSKVAETLTAMESEFMRRRDLLVVPAALAFEVNGGVALRVPTGSEGARIEREHIGLTDFSRRQLFDRLGIPGRYADDLLATAHGDDKVPSEEWAADLLGTNLRTLAANNVKGGRLLLRTVDGTAKGVLSDTYRRMDASPIYGGFVEEALAQRMVPFGGALTETRYNVKFLLDQMYEPIPNEVMLFGASLTTSDYGAGRFELAMFTLRLWCTNGAIGTSLFKQVHLGKRLDDTGFSQQTYDLDTQTISSAVRDMVSKGRLVEEGQRVMGLIEADAKSGGDLNAARVLDGLRRKGTLTRGEAANAEQMYATTMPVEALPQQPGAWRLSNVLSLLAQSQAGDRALDFERAAHEVLTVAAA